MAVLKSYNAKDVLVIFGGVTLSGLADGSFVEIARSGASFSDVRGCDGEVTRLKTKETRGSIAFILTQTSDSNLALSSIFNGDELLGRGVLPLLVVNKKGVELAAAAEAWIFRPPQVVYSKNIEARRWTLRCNGLRLFLGG